MSDTNLTPHDSPSTDESQSLLHLYLRDHDAASAAGVRLIGRCHRANVGTPLAAQLAELELEVEQEQQQLRRLMDELGVTPSRVKRALAIGGESVGRLVPNGHLWKYSPLSRVLELEALSAAVAGKLRLWQALSAVAVDDRRLEPATFEALEEAAQRQLESLTALHRLAVELAFAAA